MSIATSTARIQYTLSGTVQALPIPFYFLENWHIKAIRSRSGIADYVMILGTDYTLAGAADEDGGTLTTIATNMQVGDIITIKRSIAITQTVNYVYNDRFPAETHERALDKLTMIVQQLKEATDRSVQFPESEVAGTGNIMPSAADRAAKIFGFDASGNAVQLYDPVSVVFAAGDAIYANTVAALKAVDVTPLLNGQQCHVAGYSAAGDGGGGTWVYVSASAAMADVGTIVAPNAGTGRWFRIYSGAINVRWCGAKGDGVTNETTAIQAAISIAEAAGGGRVLIPKGSYLTDTLTLKENVEIVGEGIGATVLVQNNITSASYGTLFVDSGAAGTTVDNIRISRLTIDGGVAVKGFSEFTHLVSLSGVRNVVISEVQFLGFRGDGLYLGSSPTAGQERHNYNVTVSDCVFDGVNKDNRNGLSIIDGDGVVIERNQFLNTTKSTMPGAIDLEPDASAYHVVQNVTIQDNYFSNIGGNVGAVSIVGNTTLTLQINNVRVLNNTFQTTNIGIIATIGRSAQVGDATVNNEFVISGNKMKAATAPFHLFGVKGCEVEGNFFASCTADAKVAFTTAASGCQAINVRHNHFFKVGSGSAGIGLTVFWSKHVVIDRNVFTDCGNGVASYGISLNTGTSSYLSIIDNMFSTPTGLTTVAVIKEAAHTLTPATNTLANNILLDGLVISGVTATGAANRPDYYETGAWTPKLETDAGTQVHTFTKQWGRYTRIGNLVIAQFHVTMTAKDAGATGAAQIGSLPFTVLDDSGNGFWAGSIALFTGLDIQAGYTQVGIAGIRTTTKARLYQSGDAVVASQLVVAMIVPTTDIVGTIIYQTA